MGALHKGHLHLIDIARQQCDIVVVSVYVNALQFGDANDFDKYPRSLDHDYEASITAGASIVFAPTAKEMFPEDFDGYLSPSSIANEFEGASRPGHFAGVVTVVNRLFDLVKPQVAVFGAKDFQQVAVIREMVRSKHPSIKLLSVNTVRDADGLALSSRNARLSPSAREKAKVIPDSLSQLNAVFQTGQQDVSALKQAALEIFATQPELVIEYLEIVDRDSLKRQDRAQLNSSVVLFAGIINGIRLIDNLEL
jgi:pantoate--beta-alanine ligase